MDVSSQFGTWIDAWLPLAFLASSNTISLVPYSTLHSLLHVAFPFPTSDTKPCKCRCVPWLASVEPHARSGHKDDKVSASASFVFSNGESHMILGTTMQLQVWKLNFMWLRLFYLSRAR